MGKINVLDKQTAELIAAGEVVERPASVIKELVENSIDAGATIVTVEIKSGGILYMRVTDNGAGFNKDDVKTAFLRHATSKITKEEDLDNIGTLGFRGEALAAISSVSKVELLSKTADEVLGTRYTIEGGEECLFEDAGCPDGTTIVIRDLFYNTPARMKFLKKDVSEANAVAAILDRIALSHPEVSVRLIRDGKQALTTPGDGKLYSTVYSVLGRDFSASLIPASYELNGINVDGYVCKPISCRPNRNMQFFFINGRFVKTGTGAAAIEQAYKNSSMVGKFPACVLNIKIPFGAVDVNVHPAKTQVRFSDEKRVFSGIFYAVKNALSGGDTRPQIGIKENEVKAENPVQYKQTGFTVNTEKKEVLINREIKQESINSINFANYQHKVEDSSKPLYESKARAISIDIYPDYNEQDKNNKIIEKPVLQRETANEKVIRSTEDIEKAQAEPITEIKIKCIGEAFETYIICEIEDKLVFLDKHAAHERIIYEELRQSSECNAQQLLNPVSVSLVTDEYSAIIENLELLNSAGFEMDDFGDRTVIVRSIPAILTGENVEAVISEIAGGLIETPFIKVERLDWLYHSVACRAAVKAGGNLALIEMQKLAERVLENNDIMYCPHGRPVAFELTRKQLEKQFGRLQ